ncbi:MAG: hypothetical protein Kow00124_19420 [Anaerolineae bacterium]
MIDLSTVTWDQVLWVFVLCAGSAVAVAIALLTVAARQIKQIDIPEDADFFETLQRVPITVPLALDLLDLAFDFFAAPIAWVILELLGLRSLQMITVFEGLIPGTQLIPTMTAAWIIARIMPRKERETPLRTALRDYQREQLGSARLRSYSLQDEHRRRPLLTPGPTGDIVDGDYFEEDLDEPPPDYYDEEIEEDLRSEEDEW